MHHTNFRVTKTFATGASINEIPNNYYGNNKVFVEFVNMYLNFFAKATFSLYVAAAIFTFSFVYCEFLILESLNKIKYFENCFFFQKWVHKDYNIFYINTQGLQP